MSKIISNKIIINKKKQGPNLMDKKISIKKKIREK